MRTWVELGYGAVGPETGKKGKTPAVGALHYRPRSGFDFRSVDFRFRDPTRSQNRLSVHLLDCQVSFFRSDAISKFQGRSL